MMSAVKVGRRKHVPNVRLSKVDFRFLPVLLAIALTACYPATYREVPIKAPVAREPITQVYFYPKEGQTTERQSRDHYECYNWAVQKTGFDPGQSSIPSPKRVKVVPMPPPGHDTAVLSIAGAVLGALVAGPRHTGAGALIGAGTGAIAGAASDASRQRYADELDEAYKRNDQSLDERYGQKAGEFRRAMAVCLEGRGYSVK